MIQLPAGFDVSTFASELLSIGKVIVSVSGVFTAFHYIKRIVNKI